MTLDPTLRDLLADPVDHGPLTDTADGLVNPRTAARYPVRDGLAALLPEAGAAGALPTAAFDGVADWYDDVMQDPDRHGPLTALVNDLVAGELGRGPGLVLDVACGTGLSPRWLTPLGWTVLGVDYSADQVGIARTRLPAVQGDAAALPFRTGSLDAVITTFSAAPDHDGAVREAARVLRPGGLHVAVFVHPVLNGGFSTHAPDGSVLVDPGYLQVAHRGPDQHATTIRGRVGSRHLPLDARLAPYPAAGLRLRTFREIGEQPGALPSSILTTWTREDA
ncbi:MAG TPA: methyltransferase domain-containing protein [Cellulomonas sp.]